jgi:hypothetical protein
MYHGSSLQLLGPAGGRARVTAQSETIYLSVLRAQEKVGVNLGPKPRAF